MARRLIWAVGLLIFLGALPGCSQETGSPEVVVLKNPPPLPDDTWCVVSNELAKPGFAVSYHGQTYFLCCKKCIKAFKANPERYASSPEAANQAAGQGTGQDPGASAALSSGPGADAPPPGTSAAHQP